MNTVVKVAATDMRYFARRKLSRSLVHHKMKTKSHTFSLVSNTEFEKMIC